MYTDSHGFKREREAEIALNTPIPKRSKQTNVTQFQRPKPPPPPPPQAPPPPPRPRPDEANDSDVSPAKSVSSCWSASSYGGSPPKSRLEMKKMKRHLKRNEIHDSSSGGNVSSAHIDSESPSPVGRQSNPKRPPPTSIPPLPIKKEVVPVQNITNRDYDMYDKTEAEESHSFKSSKSDTRITISIPRKAEKKKVEMTKVEIEEPGTVVSSSTVATAESDNTQNTQPSWMSAFLVGGNIAEKVKLSRRRASVKNTEAAKEALTKKKISSQRSGLKSPVKSSSKTASKRTSSSKPKTNAKDVTADKNPIKDKKKRLRISLKMSASKKLKLSMSKSNKTQSGGANTHTNAIAASKATKKKPPAVVQIRTKHKKKKKVVSAASSSSESDSDSSSSGSGSSSSGSSDSDSGSSSDSSGSSSSGSSSGDSSDDDSSSDSDGEVDRKRKTTKVAQRRLQPTKTKAALKSRGKEMSETKCKIREMEKDEIDNAKLPCDNVPKVRPLTQAEIRAILAEDDYGGAGTASTSWVRRSTRQPSRSAVTAPNVRAIIGKLEMNDPDMVVLKCKKYLSDSDTPSVIIDALLDALEKNSNCQALYIQNFNTGMRDEQVLHLLRILQLPTCKIWCLNIGETYNVKRRTWAQFTNGLKKTNITHMYASEHTISSAMKEKIRETIRENRKKQTLHVDPNNLDVIVQCTHCWWNPINAKVLQPFIKQRGYEYLLFDKIAQGDKNVVTDASKI